MPFSGRCRKTLVRRAALLLNRHCSPSLLNHELSDPRLCVAYGAGSGAVTALLLFSGRPARIACAAAGTGAGLGVGYTHAQTLFQLPHEFLPPLLATATETEDVWDAGVVEGIKQTGCGAVAGAAIGLLGRRAAVVGAGAALGAGCGAGKAAAETFMALKSPQGSSSVSEHAAAIAAQEKEILEVLSK